MQVSKVVQSRIVTVEVDSIVEIVGGRCERLLPSDWEQAAFRWPHPMHDWRESRAIAINVEITGRTFQVRSGGNYWVKARVEWVGDGEPSTFSEAWLRVEPWNLPRVEEAA